MLAEAHPRWTFVGVDPAREMLLQAERVLGRAMERVMLAEGYIDAAPAGPFDAATYLLSIRLRKTAERETTVRAIHRRLRPGAPFVAAHGSFPQADNARSRWLVRCEAYTIASEADPEQAGKARAADEAHLPALTPEDDAAILARGGFHDVELFYAAFTWRRWVARA
ncbi:class I SAM-dependent methyltransferase [Lichenibacterium minor]|uniref:class I SAM-dependent methyltransferase n=1 Tax=Lichenibacterium minor TaxID=2316528 RepID=UPI00269872AC